MDRYTKRHIRRWIKRKYKFLEENPLYKENKDLFENEIANLEFGDFHQGALPQININSFLPLIDNFFRTYYDYHDFLNLVDTNIFIYNEKELLDYIDAYKNKDAEKLSQSRIDLPVNDCYMLLTDTAVFYLPTEFEEFKICAFDSEVLTLAFDLIHEFTHKLHCDINPNYNSYYNDVVAEALAFYNTYLFSLYIKDIVSGYDVNLVLEQTDQNIRDQIYYRNLFKLINDSDNVDDIKLSDIDLSYIDEYYSVKYFPASDYSHHFGYILYKNYLEKYKDLSLEDRANFVKQMMKEKDPNIKEVFDKSKVLKREAQL